MQRHLLAFTAVALLAATLFAQRPARVAAPIATASINKVLADAVARGDIPGVVALATDRRGIVYQGAFGVADISTGRRLEVDTIFRIASMTKPITSLAVMQLVEKRQLSLDDPAEKYLPQLANLEVLDSFDATSGAYTLRPARTRPTVRHLLTHTAGLGYNFTSPVVRDFKPRAGEAYAAGPLLFEPGEDWLYSTGIDWAGRIVESLSGQNLENYFRERVFKPLGMVDTAYNAPEEWRRRMAVVHRRQSGGAFQVDQVQPPMTVTQFNGGGGLASTGPDYIRFLQMLLNGGRFNGARIVSEETVAAMGRNHIGGIGVRAVKTAMPERSSDFTFVEDGRDKWGIGFMITAAGKPGGRAAGSLSWGGINNTYFWVDPARGIAGVILMQYLPFADSRALAVYDAFEREVYRHL